MTTLRESITLSIYPGIEQPSKTPRISDWQAAKNGCQGVFWGALDKVAHALSLPGYTDLIIHCER